MNLTPQKIGILGGGQLARMLVIEGHKLGHEMHVLSSRASDPAALVTRHWHEGEISHLPTVKTFLRQVDFVTFESEFIADSIAIDPELRSSKSLAPRLELISELSDRLKQKSWLEKYKIPTAGFAGLLTKSDAYSFLNADKKRSAVVFKKRRYGYDGFGTFILKDKKQIESWLNKNEANLGEFIVEDYIKFSRELAVQIAVNAKQDVHVFPLVEWQAEDSKCLWVKGPAKSRSFNPLLKKIVNALKSSGYTGVAAFEFFETARGLYVNEVAPRVHNSGHYSLEALSFNQFAAHLTAITNQPLPKTSHLNSPGFAMYNLIGKSKNKPVLFRPDNAALHWYGKDENRVGRKMGHITALASTPDRALKEAIRARKGFVL